MRHVYFQPVGRRQARPAHAGVHDPLQQFLDRVAAGDARPSPARPATDAVSQWTPRVDIREEDTRFVILADLPGVDPQDVEIWMDKGILRLTGERRAPGSAMADTDAGIAAGAVRFSRIEREAGAFDRRFALPDSADATAVSATGQNGVLEISIPKRPDTTPRRIEIETAHGAATRQ